MHTSLIVIYLRHTESRADSQGTLEVSTYTYSHQALQTQLSPLVESVDMPEAACVARGKH